MPDDNHEAILSISRRDADAGKMELSPARKLEAAVLQARRRLANRNWPDGLTTFTFFKSVGPIAIWESPCPVGNLTRFGFDANGMPYSSSNAPDAWYPERWSKLDYLTDDDILATFNWLDSLARDD